MYNAGDKPGAGKYKCEKCGLIYTLHDDDDMLPQCEKCNATTWTKVE